MSDGKENVEENVPAKTRTDAIKRMEPCVSCGAEWSMTGKEVLWWEHAQIEWAYRFPKRCPECRKKKREEKTKKSLTDVLRNVVAQIRSQDFEECSCPGLSVEVERSLNDLVQYVHDIVEGVEDQEISET